MNLDIAKAWLIVGLINEHFPSPRTAFDDDPDWEPVMGTSGCTVNCGPCSGLHWLSRTISGRAEVDRLVRLTRFQEGGWDYWDETADTLRWDWFTAFWDAHLSCGASGGVPTGCSFDDDEPTRAATESEG